MAIPLTLLTAALVDLVAGLAFAYAALCFWKGRSPESRGLAARSFAAFWLASGVYNVSEASMMLAAGAGAVSLTGYIAWRMVSYALAGVILGGLAVYLLYLFTGSERWLVRVAAFYAVVLAYVTVHAFRREPYGIDVGAWRVDLAYRAPLDASAIVLIVGLLLPPIVGAIAYGTLAKRASDPRQRMRIRLVSVSIAVWYSAAALGAASGADWWQFSTRALLGLVVAGCIVVAYAPGGSFAAWAGGRVSDPHARLRPTRSREQRDREMRARVRGLI